MIAKKKPGSSKLEAKKPKLKKQTLRNLDVKNVVKDVKGGAYARPKTEVT